MSIFQKDFCSISFDSKIFKIFFASKPQHLSTSICNLYNFIAFAFTFSIAHFHVFLDANYVLYIGM